MIRILIVLIMASYACKPRFMDKEIKKVGFEFKTGSTAFFTPKKFSYIQDCKETRFGDDASFTIRVEAQNNFPNGANAIDVSFSNKDINNQIIKLNTKDTTIMSSGTAQLAWLNTQSSTSNFTKDVSVASVQLDGVPKKDGDATKLSINVVFANKTALSFEISPKVVTGECFGTPSKG